MNTFNKYMVGVQGENIVVLNPPDKMTKEEALTFAAWIVTLADDNEDFGDILTAVHNT